MAMSLNRAQIIGNLTRDPEVRQIPGGQMVASFGVATNFTWMDSSGEKKEKAEFHNVVAWGKLAEICGNYLKKGGKVFIEGRIQTRDWEAEDGTKRYRTEIVAENMIMLDRKSGGSGGQPMAATEPVAQASSDRGHAGIESEAKSDSPKEPAIEKEDPENIKVDDLPF